MYDLQVYCRSCRRNKRLPRGLHQPPVKLCLEKWHLEFSQRGSQHEILSEPFTLKRYLRSAKSEKQHTLILRECAAYLGRWDIKAPVSTLKISLGSWVDSQEMKSIGRSLHGK